ncbi:hypothetical protein SKPI104516_06815 [Skermania piniformis]
MTVTSVKSLLARLSLRGPHRVQRGNLALAGQPGVVYTPAEGFGLPAVAFGHGWLAGAANYAQLLDYLASWGIVAAAPDTERGPVPSHTGLATDLCTTLDICTKIRLGTGSISVHPEKLALAGHGMGAGAAVLAAGRRPDVQAVGALFPAPTAPPAESVAAGLKIPALILAAPGELGGLESNAAALNQAWQGPTVLRTIDKSSSNGIVEGRRTLALLGFGRSEPRTARTTRALLAGFLLGSIAGDPEYRPFLDPAATIPRTAVPSATPPDPAASAAVPGHAAAG